MSIKRVFYLLAVAWLASIVLAYYLFHLPLIVPVPLVNVAGALARTGVDVAAVALTITLGGALGTLVVPGEPALSAEERVALAALLGLAAISVAVLAVGLLGLFPPGWLGWIGLVGLLGLLYRPALRWLRQLRAAFQAMFAPLDSRLLRWIRAGVVALLVFAAIMALAPPSAWDALMYHLAGGRLYLEAGRIVSTAHNYRLGFPQLVLMLYTWLMILARPHAGALLHWSFGCLLFLAMSGFARRLLQGGGEEQPASGAGWLAAAALLVSEGIWGAFSVAYSDLAAMAYGFAALVALLTWHQAGRKTRAWLLLAGAYAGCMIGTKYTAYGSLLGLGFLTLWLARKDGVRGMLRAGSLIALVAAVAFLPWLVKNVLIDHNPIAPFIWGSASFDELDMLDQHRPGSGLGLDALVLLPLQATIFGLEGRSPYNSASGPLLLALIPFAFLEWRRRSTGERSYVIAALVCCLPACLAWVVGAAVTDRLAHIRYLYPAYPPLAVAAAVGYLSAGHLKAGRGLYELAGAPILAALGLTVAYSTVVFALSGAFGVVTGLQTETEYLAGRLPAYYAAMQEIERLPEGSRVLMLWEPRPFYCQPRCVADDALNTWWRSRQLEPDPFETVRRWQEAGYTHVLVYEAGIRFLIEEPGYDPLTAGDIAEFDRLRGEALVPQWEMPGLYTLFEIRG